MAKKALAKKESSNNALLSAAKKTSDKLNNEKKSKSTSKEKSHREIIEVSDSEMKKSEDRTHDYNRENYNSIINP